MTSISHKFFEIRQETVEDHEYVFQLIKESFSEEKFSDHKEQFLVQRLRNSGQFIPELSLVATINQKVVGYILFSAVKIKGGNLQFPSLALAPVAVSKAYQKQGIGSKLINYAHEKALELGYTSIVLIGHEDYYPRFGYQLARYFGIVFPFDVPEINSFAKELKKDALKGIRGSVKYPPAFFED